MRYTNLKMLVIIILFFEFIIFSTNAISSNPATEFYNTGNKFFKEKDYDKAIEFYEKAQNQGVKNGILFYNLGCAYFKKSEIGKSILYFERARLYSPRDEDIKSNLNLAQLLIKDKVVSLYDNIFIRILREIIDYLNFREYSFLIFFLFLISLIFLGGFLFLKSFSLRKFSFYCMILFITLLVISSILFSYKIYQYKSHPPAILMLSKQDIKSAPSNDSETLFTIHEGLKVIIQEERGEWYKISLLDGRVGWLPINSVEKI